MAVIASNDVGGISDASVRQVSPDANFGQLAKLGLRGSGSSDERRAYLFFANPVPTNGVVTSATLRLFLSGAWSGSQVITAKRVTAAWTENGVTWNTKPTVDGSIAPTVTVTGGADKQEVDLDLASMLQGVASGNTWYGVELTLSVDSLRPLRSRQDPDDTLRPVLSVAWSQAPEAPDRLAPDANQCVNESKPMLSWRYSDKFGNTSQASSQVQVDVAGTFTAPEYDSGQQANTESQWDLSLTAYAGVSGGATRFWRVRVWDGSGNVSDWSGAAQFQRDALGALAVTAPGATVASTTPTVSWTLTGETQQAYEVELYETPFRWDDIVWTTGRVASSAGSITVEHGHVKTGGSYQAKVKVWDTKARVRDQHYEATVNFSYARDGTPTAPTSLTATPTAGSAEVVLDWHRASAPDYFCVKVDGVELLDRVVPSDVLVSGTEYRLSYWPDPRAARTYEVEAVVLSGGVYKHSSGNPTADASSEPVGIWLIDEDDDTAVQILGNAPVDLVIGDPGTTFDVSGRREPVRITEVLRGYEGNVAGQTDQDGRDTLLELKSREKDALTLVLGDLKFPVHLEETHASPTPTPGDLIFNVSFDFFQSGPPWPAS